MEGVKIKHTSSGRQAIWGAKKEGAGIKLESRKIPPRVTCDSENIYFPEYKLGSPLYKSTQQPPIPWTANATLPTIDKLSLETLLRNAN